MLDVLATAARSSVVHPGDQIEGRYRILEVIAQGGMGKVFLAEHMLIKRRVAVKVLHPELATDLGMLKRFMNEASAAGTLGHPNIVESTDMGFTPERVPFIVFEYLDGALLTDEIYRVDGLPVRRALKIAMQIASALEAAHGNGIVHLDLKSDNIFLVDKEDTLDHVKVLDFGIAKFMEADPDSTQRNLIVGTPEFRSPEQITTPDQVDGRADIYALGVVLYEMLTARRPYSDNSPRILLHRIVHETPPALGRANVPEVLEQLIFDRMLAKDPAARFASMKEVHEALGEIAESVRSGDSLPLAAQSQAMPDRTPRASAVVRLPPAPGPRWPMGLFVLAVLAGLGGGGLLYAEQRIVDSVDDAAVKALENDAAQLASLFDSSLRSAHQRVGAVATAPVLRAAIDTDAPTIADVASEHRLFTPGAAEVLQLFQVSDRGSVAVVRLPADAQPIASGSNRIELRGGGIHLITSAPILLQSGGTGGVAALSTPIELAPLRDRLRGDALGATLTGLAQPVEILPRTEAKVSGIELTMPVPLPAELGAAPLTLHAVVRPVSRGKLLRTARQASWGFGALMLLSFVGVGVLRSRR
ncbi:hypothetical protein BH11MYX3_BH11MYX3_33180 [soil metagenome]